MIYRLSLVKEYWFSCKLLTCRSHWCAERKCI